MYFSSSSMGCGVYSVIASGLSEFSTAGDEYIKNQLYSTLLGCGGKLQANLITFGDGVLLGNGAAFAKFLVDNKLGEVEASKIVSSPLHKEKEHKGFQMWLWYVDPDALAQWFEEEKKSRAAVVKEEVKAAIKDIPNDVFNAGLKGRFVQGRFVPGNLKNYV